MNLLLDSHALLWWWSDDPQLSKAARDAIGDDRNAVWVSAATAWELGLKQRHGRLQEFPQFTLRFAGALAAEGFKTLPITHVHALRAAGFASAHRDPFDRMLAAQGELEQLILVTRDRAFEDFPCRTLW